jgi:protein-disulfide isomerase
VILRLALAALLAVVAVGVAVALAGPGGGDDAGNERAGTEPGLGLRGIQQSGTALGSPDAPVTMVEFADLQCPFCAEYHHEVLPALLERYVRTGKLRLELRLLRFLGPDSDRLARTAAGAAAHDRMWQVVGLAYRRQGAENSGYATDDFLRGLAAGAGLRSVDAGRAAERLVRRMEQEARAAGVQGTPSFLIGPTGGELRPFQPTDLAPGEFERRIDEELG